uniref:Uncharacterized protein n=1 Tax=Anopheles coluzzii TaxID=1518534 RepID=A0A6E8VKS0_ANOCL
VVIIYTCCLLLYLIICLYKLCLCFPERNAKSERAPTNACTTAIRWRWTQNPPKIRLSDYAARSQWQILLTVFESLCLEHPWIVPCKLITQIIYKNSIECAVFFFSV